jgi:hypothetical protein|uniref:Uncharacterized protein n=1 Tax=viral metagenome TaxID=1070528 RepID=A0A6C0C697_9ZZZZ
MSSTTQVSNNLTIAKMSGDPAKGVSICIPRVFANISWYRIKQAFIALNWGYVERVDVVPSGGTKRAFVHFAPGRFTATKVLEALCNGEQVKIVYDEPWFWKISLSRSEKPAEAPERKQQRPTIEFSTNTQRPKRGPGGRKLTIDITPINCPIAARKQEHLVGATVGSGEVTEE